MKKGFAKDVKNHVHKGNSCNLIVLFVFCLPMDGAKKVPSMMDICLVTIAPILNWW